MSSPTFPKRDPGGPEFWDLRYEARFAPWDAGKVPAQLREFVGKHPPPRTVLVPGCGSAWDVRFLAESGWDVLGIDFSPEALAAGRAVLGPHAERARLADFFAPLKEAPFAVVYERAFLCALPRRLWGDWGRRVAQLVQPGGLLAGYFYFDEGEGGPPHARLPGGPPHARLPGGPPHARLPGGPPHARLPGGPPFPLHSHEELAALLEPAFERIEDAPVADSIPVFAGRERWQVWRRRTG